MPAVRLWLLLLCVLGLQFVVMGRPAAGSGGGCEFRNASEIERLYVVWSNHFDAGFTDYLVKVLDKYFNHFFPLAVRTVNELDNRDTEDYYIWTCEAPWGMSIYLDDNCDQLLVPQQMGELNCPTALDRKSVIDTINSGNITWGALPFTPETELFDASLLAEALDLNQRIDRMLGRNSSIVMNQRDVPMLTRAAIPVLNSKGIRAISIGVNGATPPAGTSSPFVWRDPISGGEVIVFVHAGGYGGIMPEDLVCVDGWTTALATYWHGDNDGPQYAAEVQSIYAGLRDMYKNAQIITGSLDDYVRELETIKSQLPVVTTEFGDSWIYGVPSDPYKNAKYSTISRLRKQCVLNGESECNSDTNPAFAAFNLLLVKSTEHTWGLSVNDYLADYTNWSNENFNSVRNQSNFVSMEDSWREQREYLDNAVLSLGSASPLADAIEDALTELLPTIPNPSASGYISVPLNSVFECNNLVYEFDTQSGGIASLKNSLSGTSWASSDHQIASLVYQTFDEDDYNNYFNDYFYQQPPPDWMKNDFGKTGVEVGNPEHGTWYPSLAALWQRNNDGCDVIAELSFPLEAATNYGAPIHAWLAVESTTDSDSSTLSLTLTISNKTASRLPESCFFSFNPDTTSQPGSWWIVKVGEPVDPLDVGVNGSSHLHAIDTSDAWPGQSGGWNSAYGEANSHTPLFAVASVDVPLITVDILSPFPTPLTPLNSVGNGVAYNIWNNIWGTNYVQWFPFMMEGEGAYAFRFNVLAS
ncbi:glycoside hydrolase family 38 [Pelomyxa schiedti]|nr:glycoside hydrolase family 38 [Pelomyxa schiedti]